MLRMNAIRAGLGGVNYLLRAAGCAEHDHQRDTREASSPGAEYLLGGKEVGEPAGVWSGNGLSMLGLTSEQVGQKVTAEQMRAVYGRLEHWDKDANGEPVMLLGSRPRNYQSQEARLEAAMAFEPQASEERQEEIRREVKATQRGSVSYYDLTYSPVKSASVYRAALREAGETELADAVSSAHCQAVRESLTWIEEQVSTTRVGRHTTMTMQDGTRRTIGEYAPTTGMVMTLWDHSSSREGDPHMHTHAAILNRVQTEDGGIYALDGQQFKKLKGQADVIYERRFEELVTEATGARWAWRPDQKTREIIGVDRALCEDSSGRRAQIQERLDGMVTAYRVEYGTEPGRQAMAAMRREAWSSSRKDKEMLSPEALAERYARKHGEEVLKDQVRTVAEAAKRVAAAGLPDGQPQFDTEDALIVEAVRRTQELHATWDETALALEMNKLIGEVSWGADAPAEIQRLVDRAISVDGPAEVLPLTSRPRVEVPQVLREGMQAGGAPVYRAADATRYATRGHLAAEKALIAEAHLPVGPKVAAEKLAEIGEDLVASGLSPDQVNAVTGILSSGMAADTLIGPAGSGKSMTVGKLDEVWRQQFGAPVLGLATSQRATDVLEGEGLTALNTAMFLAKYMPEDGRPATERLPEGVLLVVDEAGMADTDKLSRIARLVRDSGGKLLYTGDHEQLAAVGTGGLLRLMARDASPFELTEVRRFKTEPGGPVSWEAEASLAFRAGHVGVLAAYEQQGRLRGGLREDMYEAAVRGYLADTLEGRQSVLVARTNADAAVLSRRVRDELVALGKVSDGNLIRLADRNFCGVGDVISARLNDRQADTQNKKMVVNRERLTVVGVDNRGYLVAERHKDHTKVWLDPGYISKHVTLGYAGTVHSVQGITVDTSHSLLERGMSRNSAYVEVTRGRYGNFFYVITDVSGDEHEPESYQVAATDLLREILTTDGGQISATETFRAALEADDSLEHIGAVWSLVARETMSDRHHDMLLDKLGPDRAQWLTAEMGHGTLMTTLAYAELSGHDIEPLLTTATRRSLDDAESMSSVLTARIEQLLTAGDATPPTAAELDAREARQPTADLHSLTQRITKAVGLDTALATRTTGWWTDRVAATEGAVGEYTRELGKVMDQRVEMMARAAVIAPPDWALVQLGQVPSEADLPARQAWANKVAAVGAYREMYGIDPEEMSIGSAPSRRHDPVRHVAWERAWTALGRPVEQADRETVSSEELRDRIRLWEREQQWAPIYVGGEVERARTLAEEYRRESTTRWAQVEAELLTTGHEVTEEVSQLVERAERADRMCTRFTEATARYERLHDAREKWAEHTREAAENARLAAEELDRRHHGKVEEQPVQAVLLTEQGRAETEYACAMAAEHEATAIDGELLPAEPVTAMPVEPRMALVEDAEVVENPETAVAGPGEPQLTFESTETAAEHEGDEHQAEVVEDEAVDEADVDAQHVEVLEAELVDNDPEVSGHAPVEAVDAEVVEEVSWEEMRAQKQQRVRLSARDQAEPQTRQRGDYGTDYRLDELAETDAQFPDGEPVDPDQQRLFEVDEPSVELRTSLGQVREDVDLRIKDAELRAQLAEAKMAGRELFTDLCVDRAEQAEVERLRVDRHREDRQRAAAQREATRSVANQSAGRGERELHI